ncbi:MAG: TolC family protein, partial [Bacteroidota bacterium]
IYKEVFSRKAILQKEMARLNTEFQGVSKDQYEELLTEQASLYYYTALIAKRAIEIGEQDLESAESIKELTKQKHQEGIIDVITLNTAKINYNGVKKSLNANRQLELQSLTELKMLFGMGVVDTLILSGKFDYFLPEIFTTEQLKSNLQIESAALQLKQADTQVKVSQSSLLPTLSLSTYLGRQQFRDDLGLSFSGDDWTNYSYMSLNLSIPIFSGFNNRRTIKLSKLDQQVAFNEKTKTEQNAILADHQLIAEYRLSLDDAKSSLETYRLYEENQELTFQKYEEGLISLDSYLNVFEDYIKAENTYLNSMSKVYAYYSQIIPRIQ